MFLQINDIDRNIYMIASIVKEGKTVIYKMINGTQLQETFDTEQEAESKYEEAIESTGGGGGNIPLDPDGKIPAEYLPSYVDDVIDLIAVVGTAPSSCSKGDRYYNTTSKKIFTATATDTWGSTGKDPESDKIYVNTADSPATSWRWTGSDLVLVGGAEYPTFKAFPSGIATSGTTQAFISSFQSLNLPTGNVYLGGVTLNDLPFSGNAEVEVYIYPNNVVWCMLRSSNVAPYLWTCNSHTYRGWEAVSETQTVKYLGTTADFNSNENALDLGSLEPGVYYIKNVATYFTDPYRYLYVKFRNATGRCQGYYNLPQTPIMLFLTDNKGEFPTDNTYTLGYVRHGLTFDTSSSRLYDNVNTIAYRNFGETGSFSFVNVNLATTVVSIETAQTISGKKTFSTLPESSVVPTTNDQLVNKKYVDDNLVNIQYSTMPTASVDYLDQIIQYTGATENGYTQGYFYVCVSDGGDPATYSWNQINVQPQGSGPSPSPDLPTNGVRLLKKAANSVQALGLIDDPSVDDACLVLTDEIVEHSSSVEIDPFGVIDIEEGSTIKFPKPTSFTFTGNVSNLEPLPNYSISIFSDVEPGDTERQATEWFGFNLAGPNPSDSSSWYMFEFIAGPSSSASELRASTGIVNAWVCADPSVDPTFIYIEDAAALATLVDSFGFDVYDYGMEEYITHATMKYFTDQVALNSQGEHSFREFIPLNFEKEEVTTETYKKSDLYTYNGSEWVYRDRNLSANANWDENDPTAPGYVRGRTHYVIPASEVGNSVTIDTSDPGYAFEITENCEMYDTTFYDCYSADIGEVSAELYVDIMNKLEEFYQLGFVGKEKPLKFTYGSVVRDVFLIKEEDSEMGYITYSLHNIEAVVPDQEHPDIQPENIDIEIYFGKNTPQGGNITYGATVDILSSIYEEQDKLTTLTLSGGMPEQVFKLDEKFIPQLADWNENDSTSPKYIANRTHYTEGSDTIQDDLGSESLSEYDVTTELTQEDRNYYSIGNYYAQSMSDPSNVDGNIEAKRLFEKFDTLYNKYDGDVEVTLRIGSYTVKGKLERIERQLPANNSQLVYCVAVDGGQLSDDPDAPFFGTTKDLFENNGDNSKGLLLYLISAIVHDQN